MKIVQKEAMLILATLTFSIIWIVIIIPQLMQSEWFKSLIPPLQYILNSIGFVTLCMVLFGALISYYIHKEFVLKEILRFGLGIWVGISLLFDLWLPPYYVNYDGSVILNVPEVLTGSAVDATVVWFWQQLAISGPLLYYMTYIVTPLIFIVVVALILAPEQFMKFFRGTP